MREFKDQTNRRFSNLATTIKRSQQTFNVLKHQENLTVRCTVRTGSFLDYDCPTVHDTKDGNCPLTTAPDKELVPGTTVHEAGRVRKQLTSHQNVRRKTDSGLND